MRKHVLVIVLLLSAVLFCSDMQWPKEAGKVETTLRTLHTLISVNPFPNDVPGLATAIANKTEQLIADLETLTSTLQNEMASLTGTERAEAMTTLAGLLVQIADEGQSLNNRYFDTLTVNLVTNYNTSYAAYYTLSNQYSINTQQLPIGVVVGARGGWNIPG